MSEAVEWMKAPFRIIYNLFRLLRGMFRIGRRTTKMVSAKSSRELRLYARLPAAGGGRCLEVQALRRKSRGLGVGQVPGVQGRPVVCAV